MYPLVMTNIAMEHPENKWRLMSLGKSSISMGNFPWLCQITKGYRPLSYNYFSAAETNIQHKKNRERLSECINRVDCLGAHAHTQDVR